MSRNDSTADARAVSRRGLLSAAGAGLAVAATSGLASATPDGYDVVNVVEAGADDGGTEPINDVLEDARGDGVALYFPEGEYLMDRQFRFTDFRKFGIFGDGATIRPAPGDEFEGPARLFKLGTYDDPGDWVRVQNLTFDFRPDNTGLRALQVQARDMYVTDVDTVGQHDTGTWGPYLFDVVDGDRIGAVERVTAPGGGKYASNTSQDHTPGVAGGGGPTGIIVSPYHEGKLIFEDCELGGFPNNGLYSSSGNATVLVTGGEYRNSNVANIRLEGGHNYVKGAKVVVDESRPEDDNQRGIRFDDGSDFWVYDTTIEMSSCTGEAIRATNEASGVDIQEVSITIDDPEGAEDAIAISPGADDVRIFDSEIEMRAGGQAIQLAPAGSDWSPVLFENVTITGSADGGFGGSNAVRCERDGSRFYELTVDQPGDAYRRCLLLKADDCRVAYGSYRSTHHPIVNDGSGTVIADVEAEAYDGYEAIKTLDGNDDVGIYDSVLYDGILNKGTTNLTTDGNSYPES